METKTYFAASVPAALEVARQELGAEAVLIGSRPAPPDMRHFGRLEVTFGFSQPGHAAPAASPEATSNPELDDIRRQLQALRAVVGAVAPAQAQTEDAYFSERLSAAGLDPAIAAEIAKAVAASLALKPGDWAALASAELAKRIPVAPFADLRQGESRTLAFIGAPGRGKTTAMIRIAVAQGLARRIPVRLCSAGTQAIGAPEQMARYAGILGTPHLSFESFDSLHLALNGESWKGLTLIDTPGISPADHGELSDAEAFFDRREAIEKHLVLRADARSADMLNVISRFAPLRPSRLLFTGLDETLSLVPMVETLIRSGISATFLCSGQQIPEDLNGADAMALAQSVVAAARKDARPESSEGRSRFAAAA